MESLENLRERDTHV